MADIFSPRKRSQIMARVRGRGNRATELALIRLLRCHRIRGWRRHVRLFGNPDFVFLERKVAVFVDGCFWHGCPTHASRPTSNRVFWEQKLARNRYRDRLVTRTLRKNGWHVLRIWQHALIRKNEIRCVLRIRRALGVNSASLKEGE